MNKPSSSRETGRTGVRPRIAKTPSGVLRRIGYGIAMLAASACSYNVPRVSTGPADGGGNQDATADIRPDAGEVDAGMDGGADAGSDVGEADAGEDVAADSGVDVGEDAEGDAGEDAGEDATEDAGSDVSGEDAAADVGEDVAPPEPEFCVSEPDGDLIRCGERDLCPGQPTDPDEDSDKDGCSNAVDNCNGNYRTNADSDGDGMGDGIVIGPDGVVIACDSYPDCNPAADGALPDAEGRFPPQEIWCDSDDDGDGVPNQEDCFVLDPSRDCGDREAGVREWLRRQIEKLFRGRGNSVPPESRLA